MSAEVLSPSGLENSTDRVIDIVAIHGLNGDSHATWTHPESKKLWLKDFLPDSFPKARIIVFSYNANLFSDCANARIAHYAENLLSALRGGRRNPSELSRPVLFICHSMGGLVLKKALVLAQIKESAKWLRDVNVAIMFFATPHRGSSKASLATTGSRLAQALNLKSNKNIPSKELNEFSATLQDIHREFVHISERLTITSIYEQLPYPVLNMIVEEYSAMLDIPAELHRIGLPLHHTDICKFGTADDKNYKTVLEQIHLLVDKLIPFVMLPAKSGSSSNPAPDRCDEEGVVTHSLIDVIQNTSVTWSSARLNPKPNAQDNRSLPVQTLEQSSPPNPEDTFMTLMASRSSQLQQNSTNDRVQELAPNTFERTDRENVFIDNTDRQPNPGATSDRNSPRILHNIPIFLPSNFHGRSEIIKEIESYFHEATDSTSVFCLYGEGGVGKTQCALRYIHNHWEELDAVFWISADQETKIVAEYVAIARHLEGSDVAGAAEQCKQIFKDWLQRNRSWLIVFDNVEDPKDLGAHWPAPIGGSGSILFTSRKRWPVHGSYVTKQVEVTCFEEAEASSLFLELLPEHDPSEHNLAKVVVKRLGGLPLAISHVASYLNQNPMPLQEFLLLLEETESLIVEEHDAADTVLGYDRTLASAWTLSIESVQRQDGAKDILDLFAILDPDRIAHELIRLFRYPKASLASPALATLTAHHRAMNELHKSSLVRSQHAVSTIHRLVQDAVRRRWDEHRWQHALDMAFVVLYRNYPRQVLGQSMAAQYADCDKYNAHVLRVHDYFQRCPFSMAATCDFAETLAHCGWYHYERGQGVVAFNVLRTAESICLSLNAPSDSPTLALVYALICNNLGVVINTKQMNLRVEASEYAYKAIQSRERFLSRNDPEIQELATTYSNYASNLSGLGEIERAEEYFLKGIEIRENCPGATTALLELSYYNYGYFFWKHHNLEKAIVYAEKAMSFALPDKPNNLTVFSRYLYGNIQNERGDRNAAYQTHQNCLATRIALENESHFLSGVSLHKVGSLAYDLGDTATAFDHLERACECFRKSLAAERGLLPRSLLKFGHMKIAYSQSDRLSRDDAATTINEGRRMVEEGLMLARQFKGETYAYSTDQDGEALVRPTYW